MRLSKLQRKIIKQEVKLVFGNNTVVKLFGSRANDNLKGGDIDLLLNIPKQITNLWRKKLRLNAILQQKMGEQKIDIIIIYKGQTLKYIHKEAQRTSIII